MKENLALYVQHIILNQDGSLIQSCNSIFDASTFQTFSFLDYFPLVASIFPELLETPIGEHIFLKKVNGSKHLRKGLYDFLFYVSLSKENERQIHWIIRNKTSFYTQLRITQQQAYESIIEQEIRHLSIRSVQGDKFIQLRPNINSILLVDDDAALNKINIRFIELLDVAQQVAAVRNGKEAVEFVLRQNELAVENQESFPQPEIIILDLNMPIMNGLEFLEKYKTLATYKKSKIIVLSSSNRSKEREKALAYDSVVDYWVKPIAKEKWLTLKGDLAGIA